MFSNIEYIDKREKKEYEIACCSMIGKRENQQDSAFYYVDDENLYAVVCDGMGGLGGGEIASQTAVKVAEGSILSQVKEKKSDPAWMADTLVTADHAVHRLKKEDGTPLEGGTTMVSIYIRDHLLHWASAGDSRVYLFHGNESIQLTTDLNYRFYLNQKLASGEITQQEYQKESKMGEALTSFVGLGTLDIIDRNLDPVQLRDGDTVLICSDGLYRVIDTEWLCDIFNACETGEECVSVITQIIEEKNMPNQDNYTYIIIRVSK